MSKTVFCKLFLKITLILFVSTVVLSASTFETTIAQQQKHQNITGTTFSSLTNNNSSNFRTYYNSTYGIKLQYPSGWYQLNLTFLGPLAQQNGMLAAFQPLSFASLSGASLVLNVPIPTLDTLDQHIIAVNRSIFEGGGNILESTPIFISGNPAHKTVFNVKSEGLMMMQVFTIKNHIIYNILYAARPVNYLPYLPDVQKTISSLQITK